MLDCHSSALFFRGWVYVNVATVGSDLEIKIIKKRAAARNKKYDFKSDKSWEDLEKKKSETDGIYIRMT